jgi:hypothetical protein
MPYHHALAEALRAYIGAAGIAEDRKGWLFRTARGHNGRDSCFAAILARTALRADSIEFLESRRARIPALPAYATDPGVSLARARRHWRGRR